MPDERPRRSSNRDNPEKPKASGWQLIAVQSISCAVILLIALTFRLIGGSAFAELRQSFNKSIMSNSFIATLAALLDSPSNDDSSDSDTHGTGNTTAASTGQPDSTNPSDSQPAGSPNSTTVTNNGALTTASTATSKSVSAAGGEDLSAENRKVFYAPAGATFAPLKVSRTAAKPLNEGTVTSVFGYRDHPVNGGDSFHQGLDIAADKDTPISAMYFGVVTEVGSGGSYGNYVKIYHGSGIEVMYAHCSEVLVTKDAIIRSGEIVAHVGSTGVSTGNHLHIEVKKNGVAFDPAYIVPLSWYD